MSAQSAREKPQTNVNTGRALQSFERSSVWISGPAPAPSMTSRPRSIDSAHERLGRRHSLRQGSAENDVGGDGARERAACAMQVLGSESRRRETMNSVLCHQKVHRLVAFKMTALHQNRAGAKLQQRRALARHVLFTSRDRLAKQQRGLGEIRGQTIDERKQRVERSPRRSLHRSARRRRKRS